MKGSALLPTKVAISSKHYPLTQLNPDSQSELTTIFSYIQFQLNPPLPTHYTTKDCSSNPIPVLYSFSNNP